MAFLTLIRHGQSTFNAENKFTGLQDCDLTPLGESQAQLAACKIKFISYDCAYTSVLKRAIHSLHIILAENEQLNIPVIGNPAFNERNYGSLEGLNKGETAEKYGVSQVEIWRRSFDVRPPEGESLEDTCLRLMPYFIKEIEPKLKKGENVLVVAHGNSLRALMMYLEKISPKEIAKLEIPCGVPRNYEFNTENEIANVEDL